MGKSISIVITSAILACAPAMAQLASQEPISRDAYLAVQKQRFIEMDTDRDGIVTRDEMRALMADRMNDTPPVRMIDAMFARIDQNGDGKAGVGEAAKVAALRFTRLDTNRDGILTDDERRAGMERMRKGG